MSYRHFYIYYFTFYIKKIYLFYNLINFLDTHVPSIIVLRK